MASLFYMDMIPKTLEHFIHGLDLTSQAEVIIALTSETFRRGLLVSSSPHEISVLLELIESAKTGDFFPFLCDSLSQIDYGKLKEAITATIGSDEANKVSRDKVMEDQIFTCLKENFNRSKSLDTKRDILNMSSLPRLNSILLETLRVDELI